MLIYIHKEAQLDAVAKRYPARRFVMIDDRLRILVAMKKTWEDRLTTIFARKGHYVMDPPQRFSPRTHRSTSRSSASASWLALIWPRGPATAQQATHNRRHQ
ncbi:hypothetical protein VOM14_30635 [Paraburkholderia sp. MPAMCS5]|uniref:hypothetical protein n=1 Tax=Paraburkholderia sp. MPAMCS5 TaxID=3112563 RepID=UPI002E17B402|nr:hypothetical protein [Paraburkholderia sp. MPAMCS5]